MIMKKSANDTDRRLGPTIRRPRAIKALDVKSDKSRSRSVRSKTRQQILKPCVRELKFDVSELAIGTFLMAKAWGKPLVFAGRLTIMGRFKHGNMLYKSAAAP